MNVISGIRAFHGEKEEVRRTSANDKWRRTEAGAGRGKNFSNSEGTGEGGFVPRPKKAGHAGLDVTYFFSAPLSRLGRQPTV